MCRQWLSWHVQDTAFQQILGLILPQHTATFMMVPDHICPMWQLCLHLGNQITTAVSMQLCETNNNNNFYAFQLMMS